MNYQLSCQQVTEFESREVDLKGTDGSSYLILQSGGQEPRFIMMTEKI